MKTLLFVLLTFGLLSCGERKRIKECRHNAVIRGAAELYCPDVKATQLKANVMIQGCGKVVVYECYGATPEREGSRAIRLSGD